MSILNNEGHDHNGLLNDRCFSSTFSAKGKTMREIFDHRTNPANDGIVISAIDEPGAGGANHKYRVALDSGTILIQLNFQNGPIGEVGINGITQEVLLAVVIDRLRSFQEGDFRCRENALALTKIEEALNWLHCRTRNRIRRGVEGTNKK